jgi:hypothetical protein
VDSTLIDLLPRSIETIENLFICSTCYLNISCKRQKIETETSPICLSSCSAVTPKSSSTTDSEISSIRIDSEERQIQNASALKKINEILPEIGMSPIYASKLRARQQHQQQKFIKLAAIVPSTSSSLIPGIEPLVNQSMENEKKAYLYDEFMMQLKSKFKQLEKNCDKIQLLTTLPMSLTIQQIQQEFNTTAHLVCRAKSIQRTNGPLSLPVPKAGKRISDALKQSVIDYYNEDEVSRIMPGKNDCVTIEKIKVQKRLMMSTLKECYEDYKIRHQNDESKKIGFSKFCFLRPKNCV